MKKNILIVLVVLGIAAVGLYFYMYKGHRDIASEEADYSISVSQLQSDFGKGDSLFNKKYLDKTIEVYGKITEVDSSENAIILDQKLSAVFKDSSAAILPIGKQLKIKGRFIGYDDLLEQFKMDQVSESK